MIPLQRGTDLKKKTKCIYVCFKPANEADAVADRYRSYGCV